jgi:molybdopterin-biosynthesis enzyme MoeA-like protein
VAAWPIATAPWLADRLEELGCDLAEIAIVGDRREDQLAALCYMAERRFDVVLTSGGLGPTADDLTAEVVAELQGRELVWGDRRLRQRGQGRPRGRPRCVAGAPRRRLPRGG